MQAMLLTSSLTEHDRRRHITGYKCEYKDLCFESNVSYIIILTGSVCWLYKYKPFRIHTCIITIWLSAKLCLMGKCVRIRSVALNYSKVIKVIDIPRARWTFMEMKQRMWARSGVEKRVSTAMSVIIHVSTDDRWMTRAIFSGLQKCFFGKLGKSSFIEEDNLWSMEILCSENSLEFPYKQIGRPRYEDKIHPKAWPLIRSFWELWNHLLISGVPRSTLTYPVSFTSLVSEIR